MVEPLIVRPLVLSDPADDPVLYTAADGKADILCTRNIRHFDAAGIEQSAHMGQRVGAADRAAGCFVRQIRPAMDIWRSRRC